ncbi:unnamed protein product, partial [Laminaria digitata]
GGVSCETILAGGFGAGGGGSAQSGALSAVDAIGAVSNAPIAVGTVGALGGGAGAVGNAARAAVGGKTALPLRVPPGLNIQTLPPREEAGVLGTTTTMTTTMTTSRMRLPLSVSMSSGGGGSLGQGWSRAGGGASVGQGWYAPATTDRVTTAPVGSRVIAATATAPASGWAPTEPVDSGAALAPVAAMGRGMTRYPLEMASNAHVPFEAGPGQLPAGPLLRISVSQRPLTYDLRSAM